jgi:hypothetical protein
MIDKIERDMELDLNTLPIYTQFLKNIKGVGVWIAAGLVSLYPLRFHSISAMRKHSGWYVINGRGVDKSSKEIGPDGKLQSVKYSRKARQIYYDFFDGIMKAKDPVYYQNFLRYRKGIYQKHLEYVDRKATKGKKIEGIPIHIMKMAKRKVIQKFQTDLFCIWRDLEGLPQTVPYSIGVLKHEGFIDPLTENQHYKRAGGIPKTKNPAASSGVSKSLRLGVSQA